MKKIEMWKPTILYSLHKPLVITVSNKHLNNYYAVSIKKKKKDCNQ